MHYEFLDINMTKKKHVTRLLAGEITPIVDIAPWRQVCANSPLPPSAQDPSSSFFKPTAQPARGIFLDSSLAKDICGSEVLLLQF